MAVNPVYKSVRHQILFAIRDFVHKMDKVSKEKAESTIHDNLNEIVQSDDNSDGGKRDRKIVLEIFDFLGLVSFTYDLLLEDFFESVSKNQFVEAQLKAERIFQRFPGKILDFRLKLIEKHGSTSEEERRIIGFILNKTPMF